MTETERRIKKELKDCFKLRNISIEHVHKNKIEYTRIKIEDYTLDLNTAILEYCASPPSFHIIDVIIEEIKEDYILWKIKQGLNLKYGLKKEIERHDN